MYLICVLTEKVEHCLVVVLFLTLELRHWCEAPIQKAFELATVQCNQVGQLLHVAATKLLMAVLPMLNLTFLGAAKGQLAPRAALQLLFALLLAATLKAPAGALISGKM